MKVKRKLLIKNRKRFYLFYFLKTLNLSKNPALCETNLDNSIDSGNFSVRGYLPLIRKDSDSHMHNLAVYVKEGLPFTLISRKLCGFLFIFSTGFTSFSVLHFFLYRSPSLSFFL